MIRLARYVVAIPLTYLGLLLTNLGGVCIRASAWIIDIDLKDFEHE